jgi:hypothetical protein
VRRSLLGDQNLDRVNNNAYDDTQRHEALCMVSRTETNQGEEAQTQGEGREAIELLKHATGSTKGKARSTYVMRRSTVPFMFYDTAYLLGSART